MARLPDYELFKGKVVVTPSDTVDLTAPYNDILVILDSGNVKVMYEDGSTHTWTSLVAYDSIAGKIKRVYSTGTTVAGGNILAFAYKGMN